MLADEYDDQRRAIGMGLALPLGGNDRTGRTAKREFMPTQILTDSLASTAWLREILSGGHAMRLPALTLAVLTVLIVRQLWMIYR